MMTAARSSDKLRTARTVAWLTATVTAMVAAVAGCGSANQVEPAALVQQGPPIPTEAPDARDTATSVAAGTWRYLPVSPAGPLLGPVLAWDGREVLQVGGVTGQLKQPDDAIVDRPPRTETVAFTPADHQWRRLDPAPFPVAADHAVSVWTGRALIVLTAHGAAALTPSSGHWHPITTPPIDTLDGASAVWSGDSVVLALTPRTSTQDVRTQVAVYDPATGHWRRTDPPVIRGHGPMNSPLVATADGVVLFSLWSHSTSQTIKSGTMISVQSGVDVLRLTPDTRWTTLASDWPQHETVSSPLLTDAGIIVPAGQIWCGACSHPAPVNEHGYLADPHTLHGRPMPHGPLDDTDPHLVWTGHALITLPQAEIGGPDGVLVTSGDLAVWNPATDQWARAARSPSRLDYRITPVWAGHQLIAIDATGQPLAFVPTAPKT
jgi:hypothetical protein